MIKLKSILNYIPWMLLAILIGMGYMFMLVADFPMHSDGMWFTIHVFAVYGIFIVGIPLGLFISLLFIILDLKWTKNLKVSRSTKFISRIGLLIVATVISIFIHYALEKWIDII